MGTETEEFDRTVGNNNPGTGTRTRAPRIGQTPQDAPRTGRAPRVERAPRAERPVREAPPAPRAERPAKPPKPPKPEKAEKKPLFGFGRKKEAVSVDEIYDEHERKEAARTAAVKGGAPLRTRKEEVQRLKPGDSGTFKVARTMTPTQARAQDAMGLSTDELPQNGYMMPPQGGMQTNMTGGMQGMPQGYGQGYPQEYPQTPQPPQAPGPQPQAPKQPGEILPPEEDSDREADRPRGTGVKVDTAPIPVVSVLEETEEEEPDDVYYEPDNPRVSPEAGASSDSRDGSARPRQRVREVSSATGSMPEIERQARPDSSGGIEPTAPEARSGREVPAGRGTAVRQEDYPRETARRGSGAVRPRRETAVEGRGTVQGRERTVSGTRRTAPVRENRHVSDSAMGSRTRERRENLRSRTEEREYERSESSRRRLEERDRRRSERNDETGYEPVSVGFFIALGGLLVVVAVSVISAIKHVEMASLSPMVLCIITLIMLIMGFFLGMIPTFVTLILAAVAMAIGAITGYFSEVITALVILLGTVLSVKEWHRR
ncbi:MAG: hypothetical protein K5985_09025 [Lachnospiraceae bacterium]|nr:hypothetical protein [Lachnospiraceae bacterium]